MLDNPDFFRKAETHSRKNVDHLENERCFWGFQVLLKGTWLGVGVARYMGMDENQSGDHSRFIVVWQFSRSPLSDK